MLNFNVSRNRYLGIFVFTFDTPVRSRRERFFLSHKKFHRGNIPFTPTLVDVSIH